MTLSESDKISFVQIEISDFLSNNYITIATNRFYNTNDVRLRNKPEYHKNHLFNLRSIHDQFSDETECETIHMNIYHSMSFMCEIIVILLSFP